MKLVVVAALVLATGTAHADSRAKLFPLSSSKSMRSSAGALTDVIARSFGAETATVTIDDAAGVLGCSLADRSCLESIADSAGVSKIVFGRVQKTDDGATVKITTFEVGKNESQRTFTLTGDSTDALVDSLTEALDDKVRSEKKPAPQPVDIDPPPVPEPRGSGVTTGTWAMIIGGGVTLGVGLGVVVSANSVKRELSRAPSNTAADIEYIIALEKAGKQRVQIGGAIAAVGGVVATIGVIRMVVQKRAPRPEEPRLDVVPESGGASVLFTMGWR